MNQGLDSHARENTSQNVGAEHAVAVVVAMNGDPLPISNGSQNAINSLFHRWNRHWIGKIVPGWIFHKRIDVFNAASGEDVEQQWVEKHCSSSQDGIVRTGCFCLRSSIKWRAQSRTRVRCGEVSLPAKRDI